MIDDVQHRKNLSSILETHTLTEYTMGLINVIEFSRIGTKSLTEKEFVKAQTLIKIINPDVKTLVNITVNLKKATKKRILFIKNLAKPNIVLLSLYPPVTRKQHENLLKLIDEVNV